MDKSKKIITGILAIIVLTAAGFYGVYLIREQASQPEKVVYEETEEESSESEREQSGNEIQGEAQQNATTSLEGFSLREEPLIGEDEPLVGEVDKGEWMRYINPDINLAFKYPNDWSLNQNDYYSEDYDQYGERWVIDFYKLDSRFDDPTGSFEMQIHSVGGGSQAPAEEEYGKIIDAEEVIDNDTIDFVRGNYRFNIRINGLESEKLKETLDSFVFLPPPSKLTQKQQKIFDRATWEKFSHEKYDFTFEYPPGWELIEYNEVKNGRSINIRMAPVNQRGTEGIRFIAVKSDGTPLPEMVEQDWIMPEYVPDDSKSYGNLKGAPTFIGETDFRSEPVVHFGTGGYWFVLVAQDIDFSVIDRILPTIKVRAAEGLERRG